MRLAYPSEIRKKNHQELGLTPLKEEGLNTV
jgi:hypothetical protein